MNEYAVFGVGKTTEYKPLVCSKSLKGSDAWEAIRKIGMMSLPDKQDAPALLIMPVKERKMIVGEVTNVSDNPIEPRTHTCAHYFVMDGSTFTEELKNRLSDSQLDNLFVHEKFYEVRRLQKEGKLNYRNMDNQEGTTSRFYKSLTPEQRWKLFLNLVRIIQDNIPVAIKLKNKAMARDIQADFYKILPKAYALRLSSLTYGTCRKVQFNIVFTTEDNYSAMYQMRTLEEMLRHDVTYMDSYSYLKAYVTCMDEDRNDFFDSVHMSGDKVMSLEEMEIAAENYYMQDDAACSEEEAVEYTEDYEDSFEEVTEYEVIDEYEDKTTKVTEESVKKEATELDCVKVFQECLAGGKCKLEYIEFLRKILLIAYMNDGMMDVRSTLREELRKVYLDYMKKRSFLSKFHVTERERLFVLLLLLTCEFTQEEQEYYYSRNPHFVKRAPYDLSQFEDFVEVRFRKRVGRRIKRIYKKYKKMMK